LSKRSDEYENVTKALMILGAEKGWTLEYMSGVLVMNRSISTLQMRARQYSLRFPDYVPYRMRTVEERKRK
jgi:hypothetical protein